MKRCAACGEAKPVAEFNRLSRARDGLFYRCRPCAREQKARYANSGRVYNAAWYEQNRDEYLARRAAARTPERTRRTWLWDRYRLTDEQYDEMHAKQNGRCAICGQANGDKPLDVDHDHETSRVRGLLCRRCNMGIGLLGENTGVLVSALSYLGQHGADPPWGDRVSDDDIRDAS